MSTMPSYDAALAEDRRRGHRCVYLYEADQVVTRLLATADPVAAVLARSIDEERRRQERRAYAVTRFRVWPAGPRQAALLAEALDAIRIPERGLLA